MGSGAASQGQWLLRHTSTTKLLLSDAASVGCDVSSSGSKVSRSSLYSQSLHEKWVLAPDESCIYCWESMAGALHDLHGCQGLNFYKDRQLLPSSRELHRLTPTIMSWSECFKRQTSVVNRKSCVLHEVQTVSRCCGICKHANGISWVSWTHVAPERQRTRIMWKLHRQIAPRPEPH